MQEEYESIIRIAKNKGQYINETLLRSCFEFALNAHKGQTRKSGEPYIIHPIAVTKTLADLGFETNVLCAALLHDVLEDCNVSYNFIKETFNEEIADLVEAVTEIKRDADTYKLSKYELDTMSMKKFIEASQLNKEAYYIKLSDRLHNMRTLDFMKPEKQILKVRETRRLLLPIAENLQAYYFVLKLEDLCFKYENPVIHRQIFSNYERELKEHAEDIKHIRTILRNMINGDYNQIMHSEMDQIFTSILEYKRRIFDIYRQATPDISNLNDMEIDFHENGIPLKNFILRVSEDFKGNPIRLFRTFYDHILIDEGFIWLKEKLDSHKLRRYVLLRDSHQNVFRVYLLTKSENMTYNLGDIDNLRFLDNKPVEDIDSLLDAKIPVYRKDGSKLEVEDGATALDFAFRIHREIGLCAKYAIINNIIPDPSKEEESLFVRLYPGDRVEIVSDTLKDEHSIYHAKLKWFEHLTTKRAKHYLVKFFQDKLGEDD